MANHIFPSFTYLSVDDELMYQMAKFHLEKYGEYKDAHSRCSDYSKESMEEFLEMTPMPFHSGAVRYLKEVGMWTPENEAKNKEAYVLMDRYEKAWEGALADALAKKIKIRVKNKKWTDLWKSYKKDIPRFTVR
jgi:hypothetical protein